ncbi:hypothetical protein RN607_06820 [Demequina capsici]|uniref:Uncharacterized protein n=1 Tax=Demequina capsici TaxID=3075620 RepID=A0AA96FFD6_9MICO|nr:hypothetical protein [Demequina sp. PMTSA13]WNM28712.1 hypothetical protein RN607_06820 [Demequina sp. PMTSA13]
MVMTDASWRRLGGLVVIGAIAGAVWYFLPRADSTTEVPLTTVHGKSSSNVLQVSFGDCSREADVHVDESATTVTVTVRLDWTTKLDCPTNEAVDNLTLDQNLGDRSVIDGSTGTAVEVLAPEE